MELADREQCTGCGACLKACPKQAVFFQDDEEGFPTPRIDKARCIECGMCRKVCPAAELPPTGRILEAYAVQLLDREALGDSTSGGIFTALSREIFRRGGVVYGCIWDKDYHAVICKAQKEEETIPMRGSKYVWSGASDVFPEIRDYLRSGRPVLFTGLPCQAAGLRKYLNKEYPNLYIACFLCGGSPSPLAFREYVKTLITKDVPADQLGLKFRDKEQYGVGVHITYRRGRKGKACQGYITNPYYYAFYSKLINRRCCSECRYRYEDRIDDLTFGDYWGVGNYHREFDIRAGVSALLVNSEKGRDLFESIRGQLKVSATKPENIAAANNLTLGDRKVTFKLNPLREGFFRRLKKSGWRSAERRYLWLNKRRVKLWLKTKIPARYQDVIRKWVHR